MWILMKWRSRITSQHWAMQRKLVDISPRTTGFVGVRRNVHLKTGNSRSTTVDGNRRLLERKTEVLASWPKDHADEGAGPEENAKRLEDHVHIDQLGNALVENVFWVVWSSS